MDKKNRKGLEQIITLIGLILFGIIGRYILVGAGLQPFPNFEIIMVISFLAIMLIRSPIALLVPLISMVGSDVLIGNPIFIGDQMNRIVVFTYSGFAIIAVINLFNKNRLWGQLKPFHMKSIGFMGGLGVGSVLLFDIWTNLGWWYLMFPHDAGSLALVFTAGVPFMIYHMISGVITFIVIGVPIIFYVTKRKENTYLQPLTLKTLHKIPAIFLVLGLVTLSFSGTAVQVPQKSEVWIEKADQTSVQLMIVGDSWVLSDNLVAYEGDTALSLLQRCAEKNDFSVESTYYAQFDSTLVNSINNAIGGTDGKYWQYYVNGQLPSVGADKYPLTNGDRVTWSFEVPLS
ncbi:MAG: DUF4430 domain-containing protein [Candidatus Thermoplasmatota archaeon]|nr:DUF4430 domain-containing protein [Candidatus Thermoplasmatota archaeon]